MEYKQNKLFNLLTYIDFQRQMLKNKQLGLHLYITDKENYDKILIKDLKIDIRKYFRKLNLYNQQLKYKDQINELIKQNA